MKKSYFTNTQNKFKFLAAREHDMLRLIYPCIRKYNRVPLEKVVFSEDFQKQLRLIYDFGRELGLGHLQNAEAIEILQKSNLEKAFDFKDQKHLFVSLVKDFTNHLNSKLKIAINTIQHWAKSAISSISHQVFEAGLVKSLVGDDNINSVYIMRVPLPGACEHCIRVFTQFGVPKIFPLSELLDNGEDLYRKPDQMVPVLYALHFNCRCLVLRVPPHMEEQEIIDLYDLAIDDFTKAVDKSHEILESSR